MATSIANLSVQLTANTARFSSQMNAAAVPLQRLQKTSAMVGRAVRVAFVAVGVGLFAKALSSAVKNASRLGVILGRDSVEKLRNLQRSYLAFQHVLTRIGVKIATALAPVLSALLDGLTAIAMWIEKRLTPAVLNGIVTAVRWAMVLTTVAVAIKAVIVVMKTWTIVMKTAAIAKALLLALSGPAGWAALAAGAAVFGVALYEINKGFKELGVDATDNLKGIGKGVDDLKAKMLGLGSVAVGQMGVNFMPLSTLNPATEAGQSFTAANEEYARRTAEALERAQREREGVKYNRYSYKYTTMLQ